MKISLDYPDAFDAAIMEIAHEDGHDCRAAVIRKAIAFFLHEKSHKVALESKKEKAENDKR